MSMTIFKGILIPFLGTSLGAACVLFMKKNLHYLVQRALTGFAAGVMEIFLHGGGRRVELANTLYGAISENG